MRVDGRSPDEMRAVKATPSFTRFAEGSILLEIGETKVLCNASIDNRVPPHLVGMGQGWVTAEYSMLPRATSQRNVRESVRGRLSGRSSEIQRLIGRSLRSIVDMKQIGERTIIIDCDVLEADGGTRTASITGGFLALVMCLRKLKEENKINSLPVKNFLAATSVGIVEGRCVLDLCYLEDAQAAVDMNVVMTGVGELVEIQGTAEEKPFSFETLTEMLNLAKKGITDLIEIQKEILEIENFAS